MQDIKSSSRKTCLLFLGSSTGSCAEILADSIGIDRVNAYNFEASETGVVCMYDLACEAVTGKRNPKKKSSWMFYC